MTETHHHPAGFEVFALADFGDRLDAPGGNAGGFQALEPLVGVARAEEVVEQRYQRGSVLDAFGLGVEPRIGRQLGALKSGAALLPKRVVGDAEREVGISRLEYFIGDDRRMLIAPAARPG